MMFDTLNTPANDAKFGSPSRSRTVPISESITPVPGYPRKLVVFKITASKYWQVRCWIGGRTYKRSSHSMSLKVAQSFARVLYEQLLAQTQPASSVFNPPKIISRAKVHSPDATFGQLAEDMFLAEKARTERGEFARGSLQVLRNRLEAHILPRWGHMPIAEVGYRHLMAFVQDLSAELSTITLSQYLVAIRKVFTHALHLEVLEALPEFPKVKIKTQSRGAFTPTEYWRILRTARALRGQPHPLSPAKLRKTYKLMRKDTHMPPDLAWAVGFMVNSFIRPSDLKTLQHKHVEIVKGNHTYLRLTLPETKSHDAPIVTLYPAVRIYRQICQHQQTLKHAGPEDYVFLPHIKDRNYALNVLSVMLNWVLDERQLKTNAHGRPRSLYSLRHSSITFRLLYGHGIDLLTLARNARTSVNVINNHYASTVSGEQNIALLQSRRSRNNGG